ncbi:hypothetical protein GH714_021947 [Hevea brasiliensis]|uniref:SHSP domain-containing protein n=1 Tax=Hevea brasiliensis TaxID=3981 RepID=A0A6A6MGP0_HEVBR|nr:hypothetical protein GH714_021947 [Hevea brasiliensis]
MANITGKRTRSQDHVVEEFVPSAAWTEDSHSHYLLVDLPDFRKEEVKLQVDTSVDEFGRETIEKWGADPSSDSVVDKAMGILMKNKSILLTAVLAFSLGILVSRKFDSTRD